VPGAKAGAAADTDITAAFPAGAEAAEVLPAAMAAGPPAAAGPPEAGEILCFFNASYW